MLKLPQEMVRLVRDQQGQDHVEYALLAAFIFIVACMILPVAAESAAAMYSKAVSLTFVFDGGATS